MEKRDEELILDYQNGDSAALGVLFERYKMPVFNFSLRILGNRADAEDVTSEVMVILFSKKEAYVNLPGAKFSTWLYTVARNACISQIRKRKRTVSLWFNKNDSEEYQEWDVADEGDLADEQAAQREMAHKVRHAISGLPLNQKEALVLREYQKLSYQEISVILDVSVDNVKVLIFRARENLRVQLSAFITEANNG